MAKREGIRVGCGTLPHEDIIIHPPEGATVNLPVNHFGNAHPGHKKVTPIRRQEGRGRKDR